MPLNLDDLARLAIAAGREIMSVRAAGFEAMTKGDGSIVTIADQRAEKIIEDGLASLAPDVPMIGEEAVAAGRIPDISERFFCVDPLDGTRGFAKGGDEFTVNIGLIQHGAPVVGVIFAPVSGALFAGEPGRALRARVADDDAFTWEAITATPPTGRGWRVMASRTQGHNAQTRAFVAALGTHSQDDCASSIKFCRLAEGRADLYPRFGNMCEWDAAAGHAIVSAAGGGVMQLDGAPLRYGQAQRTFLITGLIAYATDAARDAALEALARM